jgi:GT2 family glycosyltransferase
MVLTHNSPRTLATTLGAIGSQTRTPDALLIVDNASSPPVDELVAGCVFPVGLTVELVRETENTGPAGGWARALDYFVSSTDHDLCWILDDDLTPPPNCLELLLQEAGDPASAYLIPSVRWPTGAVTQYPGWTGVLLARKIVEAVGLPRADFFWWTEDTEYLMWRIPRAGYPLRFTRMVAIEHHKGRSDWGIPPWKYYYETRNSVYFHFHLRGGRGRWPRKLTMLTARAILRERDHRIRRLRMIGRGIRDGVSGNLGRRIEPITSPEAGVGARTD